MLRSLDQRFTRWLTKPEANAAGHMSLYRIVFGLFYLWNFGSVTGFAGRFEGLTARDWSPVDSIRWLNPAPPTPLTLQVLGVILVIGLALLIIGFQTRLALLTVLISGVLLIGVLYSFQNKIDHSNTFMVAYIPVIMLFGRWNSNYSVDAWLQKRRRGIAVDSQNDSWVYIWPMRAILILLAFMFFGAGYSKVMAGQWLTDPNVMSNTLLAHNVVAVSRGIPANPLNPVLAGIPPVAIALQLSGLAFELCFPLALINHRFRNFFIATSVVFHVFNYFFLTISASPLIIVYLMFVDWQALYERWWPLKSMPAVSKQMMIALAIGFTALVAVLWWGTNPIARIINSHRLWVIATPVSLFFMAKYGIAILRCDIFVRRSQPRETTLDRHRLV
jgi:hypothetical protein